MNDLELYKEAKKAGFQTALIMFGVCVLLTIIVIVVLYTHVYYIEQSYKEVPITSNITQTQDGENNQQELTNGKTDSNR